MEDDRIKFFHEQYPDVFQGADALIEEKLKKRDSDTDQLIERKLAEREFAKALAAVIPNWKEIWVTPEFQRYLKDVDPDSLLDAPRYIWIEEAFKRLDSNTVINAFKAFSSPKSKTTSPGRQPGFAEIARAREELKKLRDEKSKGLWRDREKDWVAKTNALIKIIQGE